MAPTPHHLMAAGMCSALAILPRVDDIPGIVVCPKV